MTKKVSGKVTVTRSKAKAPKKPAWVDVANVVQLQDIRLIGSSSHVEPEAVKGRRPYQIKRSTKVEVSSESLTISVFADFGLRSPSDADPNKSVIDVGASFLLVYKATDIKSLSRDAIEEFADINGIFSAWPYWREFVQSITTRMGLAPLTVPVLRIGTLISERRLPQLPDAAASKMPSGDN